MGAELPGDARGAIKQLYDQEAQTVYRTICAIVLNPAVAQELTQETFLRALRAWSRFDPRNPRAWLIRIASNLAISHYRSEKRRRAVPPWQLLSRRHEPAPAEAEDRDPASWLTR